MADEEKQRLMQAHDESSSEDWLQWGPYLSERQWGTVREDYSAHGDAWNYFPHDHARSRAYRWGEDGLAGFSDAEQGLCFAIGLWNGRDPIVKERLFGLTNGEGNHGEDVKEYYFYLDCTPTHSYMKWLYKYPQNEFPYMDLVDENRRRKKSDGGWPEYELLDTKVFDEGRYFDVQVEYAKRNANDVLIRIEVTNRGPEKASVQLLPTLWFRNTWTWSNDATKPSLKGTAAMSEGGVATILAHPAAEGGAGVNSPMTLYCRGPKQLLFVDNESNAARLWPGADSPQFPKDGINNYVVDGADTVNPQLTGTKASAQYMLDVEPGASTEVWLRLSSEPDLTEPFDSEFESTFFRRIAEADEFYEAMAPRGQSADQRAIYRQAFAGLLWSKQFYNYSVRDWLKGDETQPPPPSTRSRNADWKHFYARNILSMPDKWEYPWFAAWDLCFQAVVLCRVDACFAKEQLLILAREWYMTPSGAIPAYEWAFSDVNPPLHAWAALQIVKIEVENGAPEDLDFLVDIYHYCLLYFAWWTNRKDPDGDDLFAGGFLGLDNISIIDRSNLETLSRSIGRGLKLLQSDATSWMGQFCLNLMEISIKLAPNNPEYARLANKFMQHFVSISDTINGTEHGRKGEIEIWSSEDEFYFDVLEVEGNRSEYIRLRLYSLVGVIALFPVLALDMDELEEGVVRELHTRFDWFIEQHPTLFGEACSHSDNRHLLAFVQPERLRKILKRVFSESEFLSPYGIRSLSREHIEPGYSVDIHGRTLTERYEPAESRIGLFGGNSNWRGPIWFPLNYMFVLSLQRYHDYLGDEFTVEYPTGSGNQMTLKAIAADLSKRLASIFESQGGRRPVFGETETFQTDRHWKDHVLFYEYFHGDNGAGIGASHQTGWTALVTELMHTVD